MLALLVSVGSCAGLGALGCGSVGSDSGVRLGICGGMSTTATGWSWRTGLKICAS